MNGSTTADLAGGGEDPASPDTCAHLAHAPDVLQILDDDLLAAGLVSARLPAARLIYLAVTSRLHGRPVSLVVKGPSSAGKSWLVKTVLEHCPPSSYYALSSMSEKALAYSKVSLKHRMLVLYEADGLAGDFASYLVRSLLSEGHIRYETVQSGPAGLQPKIVEREGPTGLISTTTALKLHPENETRFLSVPIADTRDSQRAVFEQWGSDAAGVEREQRDLKPWHDLGAWLTSGEQRVVLPFAPQLAALLPPHALRLQRDLVAVLALVTAHALLHRATRKRDQDGRIVATIDDYAAVRPLAEPILAAGVEAAVKAPVRETVLGVRELLGEHSAGVPQTALVERLDLDKSAVSRRVSEAISLDYLRNLEENPKRPARLVLGKPLPDDLAVLPIPEAVAADA